jgi:predicted metal-dependent phosphoesterase TrpH
LREEEVMHEFFLNKKRGVLRESYVDFARVAKLKKKIGGYLVLCHPGKYGHIKPKRIEALKKIGLDGLEVLSPHHSLGAIMYLQYLCREMKLIPTGGSDFHKPEGLGGVDWAWDYFRIDSSFLPGVEKIWS